MKNKKEKMVIDNFVIKPHKVLDLFSFLLSKQAVYKETRGVHCSLLSDGENLNLIAEDIGRHNTIDKLAGLFLRGEQKNWKQKIILTTGRVSSEMMQKSVRLGAAIVVSRTSPTSASVDFANEHNITLIGYTRRNEFTVYSNPHRIMN